MEFEEPAISYRDKYYEYLSKIMEICETHEENDRNIEPYWIANNVRFFEWIRSTNINEWRENENKNNGAIFEAKFVKIHKLKDNKCKETSHMIAKEQSERSPLIRSHV
jgi:hypothetical protein